MMRYFLKLAFLFILTILVTNHSLAQQHLPYDQLAGTTWSITDFDARYHRSTIKGTALLFEGFMLGKIVNPDGHESEPLYLNFDTVGKKVFSRRLSKPKETHEVKQYSVDHIIIFETADTYERTFVRLLPEKFLEKKSYPTFYEQMLGDNRFFIKESVMVFVKGGAVKAAYSNKDRQDKYLPVYLHYLKNKEGLYQKVSLTKKSILSVFDEETRTKAAALAKKKRTKWTNEERVVTLLSALDLR